MIIESDSKEPNSYFLRPQCEMEMESCKQKKEPLDSKMLGEGALGLLQGLGFSFIKMMAFFDRKSFICWWIGGSL